jgi:hypothetical protein
MSNAIEKIIQESLSFSKKRKLIFENAGIKEDEIITLFVNNGELSIKTMENDVMTLEEFVSMKQTEPPKD